MAIGIADRPPRAVDQDEQTVGRAGVEAGERLVEEQEARFLHERPRDRDALALATREIPKVASANSAMPTSPRASRARRRSARPGGRHQGSVASEPISATSSAETGKSSRERSVCGTQPQRPWTTTSPATGGSSPARTRNRLVLPPPFRAEDRHALAGASGERDVLEGGRAAVAGDEAPALDGQNAHSLSAAGQAAHQRGCVGGLHPKARPGEGARGTE